MAADGGYLVPPSQDPSKEQIWVETRKRLGRFLPDLFAEIFPDTANETEKPSPNPAITSPDQENEGAAAKENEATDSSPTLAEESTQEVEKAEQAAEEATS